MSLTSKFIFYYNIEKFGYLKKLFCLAKSHVYKIIIKIFNFDLIRDSITISKDINA